MKKQNLRKKQRKQMKRWYFVLCLFFVVPVLALFFVSVFDRDREKSGNEMLARFPEFSVKALFSGEFTAEFEKYFSDQFPMRSVFMDGAKYINSLYAIDFRGDKFEIDVDIDNTWEHGQSVDPNNDTDVIQTVATSSGSDDPEAGTSEATAPGDGTTSSSEGSSSTSEEGSETSLPETTWNTSWTELASPWGEETGDSESSVTSTESGILIIGDRAMERVYRVDSYLEDYADTINLLYDSLGGVRVYAMLVPKSIEFNAPAAYRSGAASQLDAINYAYSKMKLGVICVDAYSELYAHRDENIYFRTDHHWSQRGAYYGYRAFCSAANLTPYGLEAYSNETVTGFLGTMYSYTRNYAQSEVLKNNPDDVEIFRPLTVSTMEVFSDASLSDGAVKNIIYSYDYAQNSLDASLKYLVFLGGDRPVCHIKNETVDNGRKLLILKESYGNAITPFLGDMFEDVWAIDPREFNGSGEPVFSGLVDFVEEQGITDVVVLNNVQSAIPSYMSNIRALIGAE